MVLGTLTACNTEKTATYQLNVDFPSTQMAIAADEVKFVVFDDPNPGACQRIYLKRITNQADLPPVVLDPPPSSVCDLVANRAAPIEVPVGRHSILAVATRGGDDFLVGCSDVVISSDDGSVVIDLALPGATPLPPPTTCATVQDRCDRRCP